MQSPKSFLGGTCTIVFLLFEYFSAANHVSSKSLHDFSPSSMQTQVLRTSSHRRERQTHSSAELAIIQVTAIKRIDDSGAVARPTLSAVERHKSKQPSKGALPWRTVCAHRCEVHPCTNNRRPCVPNSTPRKATKSLARRLPTSAVSTSGKSALCSSCRRAY